MMMDDDKRGGWQWQGLLSMKRGDGRMREAAGCDDGAAQVSSQNFLPWQGLQILPF